jgi:predicted dehydrogenase
MTSVGIGIIGCGAIGQVHLNAAAGFPLINLVAVADLNEELAKQAAEKFKVKSVYRDGEALLADPGVEAVVLAMPTCARLKLVLKAFAKGKHVLTEKPVGMNAREVEEMIFAQGDRVGACSSSRYRFLESAAAATEFLKKERLGELRVVHCRALQGASPRPAKTPPAWRLSQALNGGGILVNWGCYDLDYLLGILSWSLKPRQVLAQTWGLPEHLVSNAAPGSDAETHFTAMVRCEGGVVISLERGEYLPKQSEHLWQIVGSHGALDLAMTLSKENQIVYHHTTSDKGMVSEIIWEGPEEEFELIHHGPIRDFAEAIVHHQPPKTSLKQGLVMQKITDGIYESARKNSLVELN